jgi:hypothetical protein
MHRLNDDLALSYLQVPSQANQGEVMPITATWLALEHPQYDYAALWSLQDSSGATVYSDTLPMAPGSAVSAWPAGALVAGRTALKLPPTLPAGTYHLTLALTDGSGLSTDAMDAGQIELVGRARDFTVPPMNVSRGDTFGGQIRLWGYDLEREGQSLHLRLYWGAITAIQGDYTRFVHLFDPATEHIAAQSDARPHGGAFPTWQWAPGEVVADDITLSLADVPPGQYRLALGWYDANTLMRLPARDADGVPHASDRVVLPGDIKVP